jgi:transposase
MSLVPASNAEVIQRRFGLGRLRWVVERTFAWLHQFRRLRIRSQRLPELHQAFMHLACAFICQRFPRAL